MNVSKGLCNGTRLEIIGMHKKFLECKIITGTKSGCIEYLPRITLHKTDEYPFVLSRHQFPAKLAFAMTINKSQGQTFEKIGLDLRRQVFAHGQLYVGFSRVRSWNGIITRLLPENVDRKVKNVVYKEILRI